MDELTVEPVQDDVEIETSGEQSDVFAVRISLGFFWFLFFHFEQNTLIFKITIYHNYLHLPILELN